MHRSALAQGWGEAVGQAPASETGASAQVGHGVHADLGCGVRNVAAAWCISDGAHK